MGPQVLDAGEASLNELRSLNVGREKVLCVKRALFSYLPMLMNKENRFVYQCAYIQIALVNIFLSIMFVCF